MEKTLDGLKSKIFLNRKADVLGILAPGIVADGMVFPSGKVCLCWRGETGSIVIHDNIQNVEKTHCHNGLIEIQYY